MEDNNQNPDYEQQLEEIEVLQNILPEKVTIVKSSPNYDIQIEIEGDNPEKDEPFKTFYLEVFLNNYYPEKPPRLKIYEINDYLNDKKKEMLTKKLEEYCQENLGMPVIYQLYEIVKEFADEEEKISLIQEKEKMLGKIVYRLNSLNKIKQVQIKQVYPIDIFNMKNGNVLAIYKNGLIRIYDNQFQNILFELLNYIENLPIIFSKYFDYTNKNTMLYLFNCEKVYIYEVCFLSKKKVVEEKNYKINGNISIEFLHKLESHDVIQFPQYPNSVFMIMRDEKEDDKFLLNEYPIKKVYEFSKHKLDKEYRKLHYINPDKFIMASYTLKGKGDVISGVNEMCLVDTDSFEIRKRYNIKISPLNNSIATYKNKYLIISYFTTLENEEKNESDPYYFFNDNFYNETFHNLYKKKSNYYYYDDYDDYDDYNYYDNSYYSYDLKQHYIGIYSIIFEQFVTKIEFDLLKIVHNIGDNLLCVFVKKGTTNKRTQISYENIFHQYYNDIPYKESEYAEGYKTEKYLAYLVLDNGVNTLENNIDYDNITCFKEINQNGLAICSERRGIILYNQ